MLLRDVVSPFRVSGRPLSCVKVAWALNLGEELQNTRWDFLLLLFTSHRYRKSRCQCACLALRQEFEPPYDPKDGLARFDPSLVGGWRVRRAVLESSHVLCKNSRIGTAQCLPHGGSQGEEKGRRRQPRQLHSLDPKHQDLSNLSNLST